MDTRGGRGYQAEVGRLVTTYRCPDIGCTSHPGDVQVWERCVEDRETGLFGTSASAVFNEARTHRFLLTRTWDEHGPVMVFVMLNPSKAGASATDPTCTRCIKFARRENCGGMRIVNLHALCATDPRELRNHPDPVGAGNDEFIMQACSDARTVVAAWGVHGILQDRAGEVTGMLAAAGIPLWCLGVTSGGQPKHPLYIRGDAPLVPYEPGSGDERAA
jgi:hypothetical protein